MAEEKTYVFGESANNGILGLLGPMLSQRGVDPNVLLAMQGRNNDGFGEGGWFIWVIFLFFLMGWGGNGFGNNGAGGLGNQLNNDYGINPCLYSKLPCESIVLLTIHADAPTGGEDLPVLVGVPSGASTISSGDTTGKTKISVVDSQGSNVTGSNVQGNTQRLAYINKSTGVIRFLEFTNPAASAA